jgi:hypothetical protein
MQKMAIVQVYIYSIFANTTFMSKLPIAYSFQAPCSYLNEITLPSLYFASYIV